MVSRSGFPFPTPGGGAEASALHQAIGLSKTNTDVVLVGQGKLPIESSHENLRLVDIGASRSVMAQRRLEFYFKVLYFAVIAGIKAAQLARNDRDIEVVHCHHSATTLLVRILGPRRTLVHTVHDNPFRKTDENGSIVETCVRVFNNLILELVAVRVADRIVAVSPEIQRRLLERGVSGERMVVVPPTPRSRPRFRESEEIDGELAHLGVLRPFILSVGDLTGRKRMDILLEALRAIPSRWHLVIVGRGPMHDLLSRMTAAYRLQTRVTLLEEVSDSALDALQRAAALGVVVSFREGFPTSLIEASRVGTPCLYCTGQDVHLPDTRSFVKQVVAETPAAVAAATNASLEWATGPDCNRNRVSDMARALFPDDENIGKVLSDEYGRASQHRGTPALRPHGGE